MPTGLYTHNDCLRHETPNGHPEQVARLVSILARLNTPEFTALKRMEAPLGDDEQITLAHPQNYLDEIAASIPKTGIKSLDADTHVMAYSLTAARRAVGAICKAVDDVLSGEIQNAFCATRPPGHHAETSLPMGFCLFGTVAIGAKYALEIKGLERVAIVDFDVHHGNGTQDLVCKDPRIEFVSSQQMPLWPGSGDPSETGPLGTITNIALDEGAKGAELARIYQDSVLPKLANFKPQMLFISAGFDAHLADPLANLSFSTQDFTELTHLLCQFAQDHCNGQVVSTLEGGYDLEALADATAAHVTVLMENAK